SVMTRSRRALLCVACALALATGCGTTVPLGQTATARSNGLGAGSGLSPATDNGLGGPDASGLSVGPQAAAAAAAAGQPAAGAGSIATAGNNGAAPGAVPVPRAGTSGRGFTATKMYVGIHSWQDVGKVS